MALSKKPRPFPLYVLAKSARFQQLQGVPYLASLALAIHYWQFDLKPIPSEAERRAIIARIPLRIYRQAQSDIDAAFAELAPLLDAARDAAEAHGLAFQAMIEHGRATRRAARLAKLRVKSDAAPAMPQRTQTQRRIAIEQRAAKAAEGRFVD